MQALVFWCVVSTGYWLEPVLTFQDDVAEPAGPRDTDSSPNHPARTSFTSKSPSHHAQHAGPSKQALDQEYDVYETDSFAQYNDFDTTMGLDANDQHPALTSVFADSPQTYGQEVMVEEQGSDSEEEMTYVGWEKVRRGHNTALEVEPRPPGPEIGSLDQDMYDDYDEQMPSLEEQVDEESKKAETSMAAAEQTQCKSVSQLPSTQSGLTSSGIWISGTVPPADWIDINPTMNGPHNTLSTSAMERLLLMATFCPPEQQYQHILPTTFWPKLLDLCAKGEKFSQIMKFVGVSYKASDCE
jgi:hypothetical protein